MIGQLVRIAPAGGLVLDLPAGSGTIGTVALAEDRSFLGIGDRLSTLTPRASASKRRPRLLSPRPRSVQAEGRVRPAQLARPDPVLLVLGCL
ncbi:hypothetical protein [Streptomyces sp. NPDC095613]|uniref:hypothetical protein n=1 Tax=Streptomyces sp. NPDC095613 TaxID=3155540 RepID=UPI0033265394